MQKQPCQVQAFVHTWHHVGLRAEILLLQPQHLTAEGVQPLLGALVQQQALGAGNLMFCRAE